MTSGESRDRLPGAYADSEGARGTSEIERERSRCYARFSCGYYWEQDESDRFTVLTRADGTALGIDSDRYLGKTSWDIGCTPAPGQGGWRQHRELREARRPFSNVVVRCTESQEKVRFFSVSGEPVVDKAGLFLGYRGIARDTTQEHRYKRLLELNLEVARILTDSEQSIDALQAAIRAICESEEWEAGQFWSLDSNTELMRFHVGWHVDKPSIENVIANARKLVIGRGVGLVGTVWQNGEPLWVPDIAADNRLIRKDIAAETGWRSALLFPVSSHGELMGVLDFNAPYIPEPDEYVLHVIRMLAAQIGDFHTRAVAFKRLSESEERYSSTVELAAIGISHIGPDGSFLHVNRRICEMLGYTSEELLSKTVKDVSHPDDRNITALRLPELRSGQVTSLKAEKRYLHKDGSAVWVQLTIAEKRNGVGDLLYDVSIIEDITEKKRVESRIEYLATHDEMTGLPNRASFLQMLNQAVHTSKRHGRRFAVLFIDLDRFKAINDSLGHEAGDTLLKTMASRFSEAIRKSDVVARLGGDEFVVLVNEISGMEEIAIVARKLISAALRPVAIKGQDCRVTASIGVSAFPEDADDAEQLIKNADMAMYLAKEEGKNNFQCYSKEIRAMSVEKISLESNLANALDRGEFRLQYQAKVGLSTGEIKGVEALLRWWSPVLGSVPPLQFIPVAEETGLIVSIGKWVLHTACAQNMSWQKQGLPPVCMAVNISPRQFRDPGLVDDVAQVLEVTGLDPCLLELEITEGMVMHNIEQAIAKLRAIKEMGVRLAIDDFGTGYSSLAQLKQFPIDTLKVDRSFIRDIPDNAEDNAITEAIIAMGRTLGVTVVAEGVETAEQQSFLRSRYCDEMQGYFFSKPSHPDEFASLLQGQLAVSRS
jgi:diguanylate cyclase (GGDEF)-like protein/PAS domain S-box-containing protein